MPGRNRHAAWLGLGGNVGDVAAAMQTCLHALDTRADTRVTAVSGLYRTPPWGLTDQADFLNCCAGLETSLSGRELLSVCLELEAGLKRTRSVRWGPRTIDLDVLAVDGEVSASPELTLPHPRIAERAFVLVPLAEIAPGLAIAGHTVGELAASSDSTAMQRLNLPEDWWRR